jgi:hypothetical protein
MGPLPRSQRIGSFATDSWSLNMTSHTDCCSKISEAGCFFEFPLIQLQKWSFVYDVAAHLFGASVLTSTGPTAVQVEALAEIELATKLLSGDGSASDVSTIMYPVPGMLVLVLF